MQLTEHTDVLLKTSIFEEKFINTKHWLTNEIQAEHIGRQLWQTRNCIPLISIKPCTKVESHREQPTIAMHRNQRKPVHTLHPISREIDPQSRLGKLRRNFLRRQSHLPWLVWMSVQAQIFLLWTHNQWTKSTILAKLNLLTKHTNHQIKPNFQRSPNLPLYLKIFKALFNLT